MDEQFQSETLGREFKDRVLGELTRIGDEVQHLDLKFDKLKDNELMTIRIELASLKVKSGVWGLVGGILGILLIILGKKLGL